MSGGAFNYQQQWCFRIAEELETIIAGNGIQKPDKYGGVTGYDYPPAVILKFKETAHCLPRAGEMAQRVDWLLSSDDGEDSFFRRWEKEVREPWETPEP